MTKKKAGMTKKEGGQKRRGDKKGLDDKKGQDDKERAGSWNLQTSQGRIRM
jgi:hypothetical protein